MDERLDKISEQLARVLSILDAKEQKKQVDRDRIKTKREEDAAETAKKRGAIVVDRLTGTFARDDRLPYEKWAYICLEFQSALDFLRWMIHEYLSSYYCLQDGRKRMIARNGNYWKVYKSCGTERLMTPTDMFGGTALKWNDMLEVGVLKWCFKHVMPVMRFCVNDSRLEFVHEHKLAWDDQKVNEECGAPLALEPRWWQKSARFREIMHACVSPYGCGYVRTSRGSLPIDSNRECLERPETRLLFKDIYNALREGVTNRTVHDDWIHKRGLKKFVDRGIQAYNRKEFMKKLKQDNSVRLGMQMAREVKEEHDLQIAIEHSIKEMKDVPKGPDN